MPIAAEAAVDIRNAFGHTPLRDAARRRSKATVGVVLEAAAEECYGAIPHKVQKSVTHPALTTQRIKIKTPNFKGN